MRWIFVAAGLASVAGAQGAVSFERDVLPILDAKCLRCHSAEKQKGGLRLDGKDWILRGGDGEDAVVAGDPDESGIWRRTGLPPDDPDFMPAKGDALTAPERELIGRWIREGADFGVWTGADAGESARPPRPQRVVVVPPQHVMLAKLGEGMRDLPGSALRAAAGESAQIEPAIPGSPLLRVSFRSFEDGTDDLRVGELGKIASHVTILELGRTRVTDAGLAIVGRMSKLTRIDLHSTAATDRGFLQLAHAEELRTIVAWNTALTDRGFEKLLDLPKLEKIHVWQTMVSDAAIEAARARRPDVTVVAAPQWPAAAAPRPQQTRRRR